MSALRARFIRAELAEESDTVSKKIRAATVSKIPNLLIVGKQEEQDQTVTLRQYGVRDQLTLAIPAIPKFNSKNDRPTCA